METRDILYRGYTDLQNCESEPIHIPGSIQPHGFLLGISFPDYIITYCSANTEAFIHRPPVRILNQSLSSLIGEAGFAGVVQHLQGQMADQSYSIDFEGVPFNVTMHRSNETLIMEWEHFPDGYLPSPSLYVQTSRFVNHLETAGSLQTLSQHVADEVRAITGYDRVMIYRFDEQYNGEVYAESKRDDLEPFLHLHYPHTDIPPQARQLYLHNLMRMISDVAYAPVPILTTELTASHQSLDLSTSILRSVSPIHIEYLKNMGVKATLTISLVWEKKLWGLIACHHYSPKILPHYTRLFAKLQAHFLTSQLAVRQTADEYDYALQVNALLDDLLVRISDKMQLEIQLQRDESILKVVKANGFVIINKEQIFSVGKVPTVAELDKLVHWLDTHIREEHFHTSRLSEHYPEAVHFNKTAAGIFYHSFTKTSRQCVIWFRGEAQETVLWAGDPEKSLDLAQQLTPRKSFQIWKQLVQFQSPAWLQPEISAALRLATTIQYKFRLRDLRMEEEKYRTLSAHLQEVNEELSRFNYVCSHDLQEPLRKIRIFSGLLHKNIDNPELAANYYDKIETSAERMSALINNLLEYARTAKTDTSFEATDLNRIVQDVQADFELLIQQKDATILIDPLPVIQAIPFQINQLFYNLMSNALKFSDHQPVIRITAHLLSPAEVQGVPQLDPAQNYVRIVFSDNGIGFEQKFAHKIFDVFKRLHSKDEFSGTGIGLALCKKIVENHYGWISAKSAAGEGATFLVYLPVL